jgi:hypothetical protein
MTRRSESDGVIRRRGDAVRGAGGSTGGSRARRVGQGCSVSALQGGRDAPRHGEHPGDSLRGCVLGARSSADGRRGA